MSEAAKKLGFARAWMKLSPSMLPFADAATAELPMKRLLRLSLFQISVGMAAVLLIGTLNRVMIVELGVPVSLVAFMVALPLVFAPLRALIGFRSDNHRSVLGWRRTPYIWFGTIFQFSGFAMMPFALILLSGDTTGPMWAGQLAAAIAFLLVGAGMHTVQTVGLALATDLAPREAQPKVVALLSAALLAGMVIAGVVFGALLTPFTQIKLIQCIQGAAVLTLLLNLVAMWKQEPRDRSRSLARPEREPSFTEAWRELALTGPWKRRLFATGLGTFAFSMQDVLLEPYGGQVLGLTVGATTLLTAGFATGGMLGFLRGARIIGAGADASRIAGFGAAWGVAGFAAVILAGAVASGGLFAAGVCVIGFGAGLFAHGVLTSCMQSAPADKVGLALGAWGAVQATAAGCAVLTGGIIRDLVASFAMAGGLGEALTAPSVGYGAVYLLEILLLFATLAVIGPLVRAAPRTPRPMDLPAGPITAT
ncbi:MAG: PucC family protein [Acetobacteraceae bacterium]|nr:PucC family protein [Acetobacteraceae bacterium]